MKPAVLFGTAAMASILVAGELDERLIRLIAPDAKFVYGVDLIPSKNSTLNEIFPISGIEYPEALRNSEARIHEIVRVESAQPNGPGSLVILRGVLSASDFQQATTDAVGAGIFYKGVLLFPLGDTLRAALVNPNTAIVGDFGAVREALDRWGQDTTHIDAVDFTLGELSRSYDAWFLVRAPLVPESGWPSGSESIHARQLMQTVESIRGGIRFGSSVEIHLEATTRSPEDAFTAAAIARWFPGFWQLQNRDNPESAVLDLAEDLTVSANGKVASLSFRLSESRLRELLGSRKTQPGAFAEPRRTITH